MAEAIAAVSLVANIFQLIQFGDDILTRVNEYQSKVGELPDTFKHISIQINALIYKLKETKKTADSWADSDEYKQALMPVVNACLDEIKSLQEILNEALPKPGDSGTRRNVKAIISIRYDAKVENKANIIKDHIIVLTYLGAGSTQRTTPPPPLPPSTNCHFARDPDFVERAILAEIMSSQHPRVALVGLGGVGKTQIAIEYTHRIRVSLPDTWVFWVHAGSLKSFLKDYSEIAEKMRIPGRDNQNMNIFKLVYDWLSNEANGNWVMVIDNADDLSVFNAQPPNCSTTPDEDVARVINFIPNSQNGSVLITSRDRGVAFILTGGVAQILHVEPMNEIEALKLLESRLVGTFLHTEKVELVRALDYMPLAISQAGSLISLKTPRLTIPNYIKDLNEDNQERTKLLEKNLAEPGRDRDGTNSIIATWHITFQYVRKTKPSAARLLSLMCLFHRQGIPETFLVGQYRQNIVPTKIASARRISWWKKRPHFRRNRQQTEKTDIYDDFDDDWQTLTNFSLIKTESDGHHFAMHRLVQLTTMKWLDLENELQYWKERCIVVMNDNFPDYKDNSVPYSRTREILHFDLSPSVLGNLLSHLSTVIYYKPVGGKALRTWGFLVTKYAGYCLSQGDLDSARQAYHTAFLEFEVTLGLNDPQTLLSMHDAAYVVALQGHYASSEMMQRNVLKARERILGPDHPDTLSSIDGLRYVLNHQKRFEEGHAMNLRALEIRDRIYGPHSALTCDDMRRIIDELEVQGKYQEIKAMLARKNATRKRERMTSVGQERRWHEELFVTGKLDLALGRLEVAEILLRHVHHAQEKAKEMKTENYVDQTSYSLAQVLKEQGKYPEAQKLYLQALEGYTKARGEDKETLSVMGQYAFVLVRLGKSEDAKELCRKVAKGWGSFVVDEDGDGAIISVYSLAELLYEQNLYKEALPLYQRALIGAEKQPMEGEDEELKIWKDNYKRCEEKLASRDCRSLSPVSSEDSNKALSSDTRLPFT